MLGGPAPADVGAEIYIDLVRHALQIDPPFGGARPAVASETLLQAYHLRALKEELEALAMLARGITLEVKVNRVLTPSPIVQAASGPLVYAEITLTIPDSVDGLISLSLDALSDDEQQSDYSLNSLEYKKSGNIIELISEKSSTVIASENEHADGRCVLRVKKECQLNKYRVTFSFSTP